MGFARDVASRICFQDKVSAPVENWDSWRFPWVPDGIT
jgi:hypothetical protein